MEKRDLTCIICPLGCMLEVNIDGERIGVSGNTCPRGENYARKEVTEPARMVTTTVRIKGREKGQVPCKTAKDIPKEKIFDVVRRLKEVEAVTPVRVGDTILPDAAGTGVAVVATTNVD